MLAPLRVVLPRFVAIAVVCVLASATITFAADGDPVPPATTTVAVPEEPEAIVVPDVRNQAYVFAKGTLQDAGLAWNVAAAGARGFAANVVTGQSPAPGTRLVDTGAPLLTLRLARNPAYAETGDPEDSSPYPGTALELADAPAPAPPPATTETETAPAPAAKPAPKPAPKPAVKTAPKPKPAPKAKAAAKAPARPAAFAVAGAPAEPLDEPSLLERARRLDTWLDSHPDVGAANVDHWLYQHSWIVTGARFGWWRGAEALELLVAVDRKVEARWGIGSKSRLIAERALAEVRARS